MAQYGKFRGLAAIALQRLSESDLRLLHAQITDLSVGNFVELIRDIEDEIENSLSLTLARSEEGSYSMPFLRQLFEEIDQIRKRELGIPVHLFAELLERELAQARSLHSENPVPKFDSRRGLQSWIKKLLAEFTEQEIYHAATILRSKDHPGRPLDWRLK